MRRAGSALESMYCFVLWLAPAVEEFPRRQKFLLGNRLQATALDVLERLVEATYTRDRRRHLAGANLGIEKLLPLALDAGRATFVFVGTGDQTASEVRTWGSQHAALWAHTCRAGSLPSKVSLREGGPVIQARDLECASSL